MSNKKVRVNPGVSDPSGVAVSKWMAGKHTLGEVKAGGKAFKGTFDIGKFGVYTVYAQDKQGYESFKVINVKNIALKKLKLNLGGAYWKKGTAVKLS